MMADEFESIFSRAGLMGDQLNTREVAIAFTTAIMAETDELNNDKHLKAYFVEFIEAFARVCDILSLPTLYDEEVILHA